MMKATWHKNVAVDKGGKLNYPRAKTRKFIWYLVLISHPGTDNLTSGHPVRRIILIYNNFGLISIVLVIIFTGYDNFVFTRKIALIWDIATIESDGERNTTDRLVNKRNLNSE